MKKKKSTLTTKTKTPRTKKQYIESHWLIFGVQGLIALLFSWFIISTGFTDTTSPVFLIGMVLPALGAIEIINIFSRYRRQRTWGLVLAIALIEIAAGISLLATRTCCNVAIHLIIIASYTILRGLFDTLIALRSMTDRTDKFLWMVTGMFGMILGFVILNSGNADLNITFIKVFGIYMMVFGLANLTFAVHSKNILSSGTKK